MKTSIYYFTGTGNSLYTARLIAQRLDAALIPIANAVQERVIEVESDVVGIVFPVYNHIIPHIVARFAGKLGRLEGKYVFAVCTYGDSPCISLRYLDSLIQKNAAGLSAGFAVKMPYNYINPDGLKGVFKPMILRKTDEGAIERLNAQCNAKIEEICDIVKERKQCDVQTEHRVIESIVDLLNLRDTLQKAFWLKAAGFGGKTDLPFIESVSVMDCGFSVGDACTRCGTCVRICPVGNISMAKEGPHWHHRCEQCFACLQWCPSEAIEFGLGTVGKNRYHHPAIAISDMINESK